MDINNIIEKISLGLQTCSQDTGIPPKDIRIKISIDEGFLMDSTKFSILNRTNFVRDVAISTVLGINKLEEIALSKYLSGTLKKLAKSEVPPVKNSDINARIYTRDDKFTPSVCIFEKNKLIREIMIDELI